MWRLTRRGWEEPSAGKEEGFFRHSGEHCAAIRRPNQPCPPEARGRLKEQAGVEVPAQMEPKQGLPNGIFGFSMMSTTGGFSSTANVYVNRVNTIADGRKYRQPVVLGAIIAHELGHLLLGIGSHSKTGLMSLPWGPKALTAADQGRLGFSKKESSNLEKAVAERTGVVIQAAL